MLVACFHVVLQLYFTSAVGKVSSVDVFSLFFLPKHNIKDSCLILKKLFLNVTFL